MAGRPAHPRQHGFTLLELILALSLAVVITSAALSLFWMIRSSDQRLSARFDEQIDLSFAQEVLRKAMAHLVAARPVSADEAAPATGEGAEDELPEDERLPSFEDQIRGLVTEMGGDEALVDSLVSGLATGEAPHFEVYYERNPRWGQLPRLEVVLMNSPVPPIPALLGEERTAAVGATLRWTRGVFEPVDLGDRLALQWRPIDPPDYPTTLIDGIVGIEWSVLPRQRHGGQWTDLSSAFLQEDYPVAVRLILWMQSGVHIDWLFETSVTTPGGRR